MIQVPGIRGSIPWGKAGRPLPSRGSHYSGLTVTIKGRIKISTSSFTKLCSITCHFPEARERILTKRCYAQVLFISYCTGTGEVHLTLSCPEDFYGGWDSRRGVQHVRKAVYCILRQFLMSNSLLECLEQCCATEYNLSHKCEPKMAHNLLTTF